MASVATARAGHTGSHAGAQENEKCATVWSAGKQCSPRVLNTIATVESVTMSKTHTADDAWQKSFIGGLPDTAIFVLFQHLSRDSMLNLFRTCHAASKLVLSQSDSIEFTSGPQEAGRQFLLDNLARRSSPVQLTLYDHGTLGPLVGAAAQLTIKLSCVLKLTVGCNFHDQAPQLGIVFIPSMHSHPHFFAFSGGQQPTSMAMDSSSAPGLPISNPPQNDSPAQLGSNRPGLLGPDAQPDPHPPAQHEA